MTRPSPSGYGVTAVTPGIRSRPVAALAALAAQRARPAVRLRAGPRQRGSGADHSVASSATRRPPLAEHGDPDPERDPHGEADARPNRRSQDPADRSRRPVQAGDQGEKVRELQHRLRQLEWFAGSITGTYGKKTTKGVKGFQDKRKFTETGDVDRRPGRSWSR